jgi:WD40 repeat protein
LGDGVEVSNVSFDGGEFCSFAPDGKTIAVAQRGGAVIANVAGGAILYRTKAIGEQVSDCRLLDGSRLLFTSDWDVQLVVWDMALDRAIVKYEGHTYTADCCAVTPDGRFALSGGGDNTVRLWSLTDKAIALSVDRHPNLVDGCAVNAAATLACSAPQEDLPAIWDARTGTRVRSLDTDVAYGFVRFCRFDNQSHVATLGQSLRLFDPETGKLVWEKPIPVRDRFGEIAWIDENTFQGAQHGAERGQVDLLPLIYAGSHVIVWQPTGELEMVKISGKEPRVSRLNSGQSLAVGHRKGLQIIALDQSKKRRKIADGVKACVGSPNSNTVYALMLDGRLCRLDATDGKAQAVLGEVKQEEARLFIDPQETTVWALCSPADKATYSEVEEVLIAFSPETPGILQQFSIAGHRVFGICFLEGMMITAGWDSTLRVWDARQPVPVAAISGSAPFRCVDVTGDRLVAGDQKGNMWFLAPMNQLYP